MTTNNHADFLQVLEHDADEPQTKRVLLYGWDGSQKVKLRLDSNGRLISSGSVLSSVVDGRREVATAGTRVQLAAASTPCKRLILTAETDNTGVIVVGGSTVVAAQATRQGLPLNAGDSLELEVDDLTRIYLDSTVNGDGVTYIYLN